MYPVAMICLSLTSTAPTLRRRQVERVLTNLAISMKYCSHEGRVGIGFSSQSGLLGAVEAIARIAQAGDDVAVFIQLFINRCRVNVHIRMMFLDHRDSFRSSDQAHQFHTGTADVLDKIDGRDR